MSSVHTPYKIQAECMICTGENLVTYRVYSVRSMYSVQSIKVNRTRGPRGKGFGSWISSNEDVERNSTIQG